MVHSLHRRQCCNPRHQRSPERSDAFLAPRDRNVRWAQFEPKPHRESLRNKRKSGRFVMASPSSRDTSQVQSCKDRATLRAFLGRCGVCRAKGPKNVWMAHPSPQRSVEVRCFGNPNTYVLRSHPLPPNPWSPIPTPWPLYPPQRSQRLCGAPVSAFPASSFNPASATSLDFSSVVRKMQP